MPNTRNPGARIVRKRLADGTIKEYTYSRDRARVQTAGRYSEKTMAGLIVAYQSSQEWRALAIATKRNYTISLRAFDKFRDTPVAEITRRHILDMRDLVSVRSGPASASTFVKIASSLFSWAIEREKATVNPAARIKSLRGGHLPAWQAVEAELGLKLLPEPLRRAVLLGMYTGQRRTDLCRLTWAAYDGRAIRLTQAKTKISLTVPVHPRLKTALDQWKVGRPADEHILLGQRGKPWKPVQLSGQMRNTGRRVGLPRGLNVHGLRKLAATMLAEAGCSTHEIAAITGHKTLSMVQLYTASVSQEKLAEQAVSRLQTKKRKPTQTKPVKD